MASAKKSVKAVEDAFYLTREQHIQEAERLAWVIDDVLQSEADRTLADLVAIARLHLDLARHAPRPDPYAPNDEHVSSEDGQ